MLTEVMEHFGLVKSPRQVGYFETDDHQRLLKDLKTAIYDGDLIVLTGIVGSGKTTLLWQLQEVLRRDGKVHVTESLAFDVPRVSLVTLKLAMFYDLASEKDGDLTLKPEKSERRLLDLIRQRERPVVLFVDDAHDLHAQTLRGLKQFMEKVAKRGNRLSVVLAGHPKLRNELVNRSTLEEIAARTTVFELEGIKGHQRQYLAWLLERCLQPEIPLDDVLTDEAATLLTERLVTPLQINHYLTRALEQAHRFGEKPVTSEIVDAAMAPDINTLEPILIRHGYNTKALCELFNVRLAEVRAFLRGQLPADRTEELKQQILKEGVSL